MRSLPLLCGRRLCPAAGLVAQPAASDAVGDQCFASEFLNQLHEERGLTDEPKGWFREGFEKTHARIAELQQQLRQETDAPAALAKHQVPDESAKLAQADRALKVENAMKRAPLTLLLRIKSRLTPAQQATLRELKDRGGVIQGRLRQAQAIAKQWQADGKDRRKSSN